MSIWIILLCILLAVIVAFLIYGYSLPAHWRIETSQLIPSDTAPLFQYLLQIRNWEEWTIWNRENDSKFEFSYEGPVSGPGATQIWKASRYSGRTQLRTVEGGHKIGLLFVFGHSAQAIESQLELRPRGHDTELVWSASGNAGDAPARRIMARMFIPYMKKDFERSLLRLQKIMAQSSQSPN